MAIIYKVSKLIDVACENLRAALSVLFPKIGTTIAKKPVRSKSSTEMNDTNCHISICLSMSYNLLFVLQSQNGCKKYEYYGLQSNFLQGNDY